MLGIFRRNFNVANVYHHIFYVANKFFDLQILNEKGKEKEKREVVVVNAGNSGWQLGGDGINGACATLYSSHEFKETERVFSLRSSDGTIGCDLLVVKGKQDFTHVYQVGPHFSRDQKIAKGEIHKLLFSNYATSLALTQSEMRNRPVVLAGASTNLFAGALNRIGRSGILKIKKDGGVIPNIVDYINALCFIQFSESLKANGLKIYMNSGLSAAMKDIQENQQEVLEWIVEQIGDENTLKNLGIIKNPATDKYQLKAPSKDSSQEFETHLLKKHAEYREVIGKAKGNPGRHVAKLFANIHFINGYCSFGNVKEKTKSERTGLVTFIGQMMIKIDGATFFVKATPSDYTSKPGEVEKQPTREIKNPKELMQFLDEFTGENYFQTTYDALPNGEKEEWLEKLQQAIQEAHEKKQEELKRQVAQSAEYQQVLDDTIEKIKLAETSQGIADVFKEYRINNGADNFNTEQVISIYKHIYNKEVGDQKEITDFTLGNGKVIFDGRKDDEPDKHHKETLKYKVITSSDGRKIILLNPNFLKTLYNALESDTGEGFGRILEDITIQKALKAVFEKIVEGEEGDQNLSMVVPGPVSGHIGHFVSYVFDSDREYSYELNSSSDGRQEFSNKHFMNVDGTAIGGGFCGVHAVEAVLPYIDPNVELSTREGDKKFKFDPKTGKMQEITLTPRSDDIPASRSSKPRSPAPRRYVPAPRSSEPTYIEQLQDILSTTEFSEEYNTVKESLSKWVSDAKEFINSAFEEYNVYDSKKQIAERAEILRATITSTVLNEIKQQIPVDTIKAFIKGEKLDTEEKREKAKPIIERQLSALPQEVRRPHPDKPKFLCKDKITLNEDGTTTVSFTFDRDKLKPGEDGRITISITFPEGILVSPDLLDAIRAGKLSEYLNTVNGTIDKGGQTEVEKQIADAFLAKFSQNSKEVPSHTP